MGKPKGLVHREEVRELWRAGCLESTVIYRGQHQPGMASVGEKKQQKNKYPDLTCLLSSCFLLTPPLDKLEQKPEGHSEKEQEGAMEVVPQMSPWVPRAK